MTPTTTTGIEITYAAWMRALEEQLDPYYATANIAGGHDRLHVNDVRAMEVPLRRFMDFDPNEFTTAAELHNSDRSESLKKRNIEYGGWEGWLRQALNNSPFDDDARDRIVYTVLHHSDFALSPDAPVLARAIQDADKLVRFRPSNLLYAGAHGGSMGIPAYAITEPFGFTTTRESARKSMWNGFMMNLEWVGMLSCDGSRQLINPDYLRLFVDFLRGFGREIALATGAENTSETDIKKALGSYYLWALDRIYIAQ